MLVDYLGRTQRMYADEVSAPLAPTFRFDTLEAARAAFDATRGEMIVFVQATSLDLYNNCVYPGSSTRLLDGYEYLMRLPAHTERHVAQMREVKAHAAFPVR